MKPDIQQVGGRYQFTWLECGVGIAVSSIHQEHGGEVRGELHITRDIEGQRQHLYQCRLNFLAPRSKSELVNTLTRSCDDVLWGEVIEQLAYYTLERFREGEPVLELTTEDDFPAPSYLIHPLVVEGHPNMIFGDPDAGKSILGLVTICLISLPWTDNHLGLPVNGRVRQVGYLDWETDQNELGYRLRSLSQGMGLGPIWLSYRRCALPLADDLEAVERMVLDKKLDYMVIDSLGPACGGDLTMAEPAIRVFTALRRLKLTTLLIAHESKGSNEKKPTAYGSVYFTALARSVWRAERLPESEGDHLCIALRHTKANTTRRSAPLGFKLSFSQDACTITREDLTAFPSFFTKQSLPTQILALLKGGAATVENLIVETGAEEGYLRKTLSGMKKRGQLVNLERGLWGLTTNVT